MIKQIVVKQIDQLMGEINKGRVINEYLIYMKIGDINIKCFNEIGEENKINRISTILYEGFPKISNNNENLHDIQVKVI